jgi:hypothetical protein
MKGVTGSTPTYSLVCHSYTGRALINAECRIIGVTPVQLLVDLKIWL